MNGRSLPRAVTMMLPEPWDKNEALPEKRRAWDAYQSMLMEAWDGPAAIAFSDGHVMGAALDRNGLRPARYYVTNDDRLILSSEIGALDVDPAMVLVSGSLGPGQMLLVDPDKDRVLFDDEIKDAFANEKPYRTWVESGLLTLDDLAEGTPCAKDEPRDGAVGLPLRQALHGLLLRRRRGGHHTHGRTRAPRRSRPWAPTCRSRASPSIRAASSTTSTNCSRRSRTRPSMRCASRSSPRRCCTWATTATCSKMRAPTAASGASGRAAAHRGGVHIARVPGPTGLPRDAASPRSTTTDVPTTHWSARSMNCACVRKRPCATGSEHHRASPTARVPAKCRCHRFWPLRAFTTICCKAGIRTSADLIVECGDAITPHDFAHARGVFRLRASTLTWRTTRSARCAAKGELGVDAATGIANYNKAIVSGIVSVMSKMGISTMQGYHSAQVFEAVGLSQELIDRYLCGTVSRVGGLGISDVQRECNERYDAMLAQQNVPGSRPAQELGHHRPGGRSAASSTSSTRASSHLLQRAVRENDFDLLHGVQRGRAPAGARHHAARPARVRPGRGAAPSRSTRSSRQRRSSSASTRAR